MDGASENVSGKIRIRNQSVPIGIKHKMHADENSIVGQFLNLILRVYGG